MQIRTGPLVTVIAIIPLVLSACAVPKQARDYTRLIALYTVKVQKEGEEFTKFRDQLAMARTRNINTLEQSALKGEQGISTQLHIWKVIKDDPRLNLYNGILEGTELAGRQQQELNTKIEDHDRAVASTKSGVNIRKAMLAKTAKTLGELAEEPKLSEEITFYVGFFQEVQDQVKKDQEEAKKQANEAADAADSNVKKIESEDQ